MDTKVYIDKIKNWYEAQRTGSLSYKRKGVSPERDWRIMLSISFFVICLLAVFAFYFYMRVDNGDIFIIPQESISKEAEINKVILERVVSDIDNKEAFADKVKSEQLIPSDPSL